MATTTQPQQKDIFYGGLIKRVFVISSFSCDEEKLKFIRQKFNSLRNYRNFSNPYTVETLVYENNSLPRINSLKEGDACLLIGTGRFIHKISYDFARKCFANKIPVYFIRSNSLDTDPRMNDCSLWRVPELMIETPDSTISHLAPAEYFMQIPQESDFILLQKSKEFYALLPAMVPFQF